MYNYSVQVSTYDPEGENWILRIRHMQKFSEKEFNDVVERAFVFAYEKTHKENGISFIVPEEDVFEYLEKVGFSLQEKDIQSYRYRVSGDSDRVENKNLQEWLSRKDIKDIPEYLK